MDNEQQDKKKGINYADAYVSSAPKRKCPNCKQEIEATGDVCPNCRHYLHEKQPEYKPIARKTARLIQLIVGAGLIIVFAILVWMGVFKLKACSEDTARLITIPREAAYTAASF